MANVDQGITSLVTKMPAVFDYTSVGTAAGTTTVHSYPCFIHSVTVGVRVASGNIIIYDSVGTSGTVLGTISCGTQTYGDAPSTYILDVRTKNALTVANTANLGAVISWGK